MDNNDIKPEQGGQGEKPGAIGQEVVKHRRSWRKAIWALAGIILVFGSLLVFLNRGDLSAWLIARNLVPESGQPAPGQAENGLDLEGFEKIRVEKDGRFEAFSLSAVKSDPAGVAADTSFLLTSQKSLPPGSLKNSLSFDPPLEYDVKEAGENTWELQPRRALRPNSLVKAVLSAVEEEPAVNAVTGAGEPEGLGGEAIELSWVFQVQDDFGVLNVLPRDAATNVPVNTGIEVVFSHENFSEPEDYFSIEPSVAGSFERHGRTLVFVPKDPLAMNTVYTVRLKAGLGVKDSVKYLEEDFVFSFETVISQDFYSSRNAFVCERSLEVGSQEVPVFQICGYNIPEKALQADIYRFASAADYYASFKEQDRLPWWARSKKYAAVEIKGLEKLKSEEVAIETTGRVQFARFKEPLAPGFYLFDFNTKNSGQVWVQVSDLAVYYNITETKTIAWVNNLASGQPAANTAVELLETPSSAFTDSAGIASFDTPKNIYEKAYDAGERKRYYLRFSQGSDVLFQPAMNMYGYGSRPESERDYWVYLYNDRPRYQPDDKIKIWGFLQKRDQTAIAGPAVLKLYKNNYYSYNYEPVVLWEQEVGLSGTGSFEAEINLDKASPGYYYLDLSVNGQVVKTGYITVRPYIKPAYQLSLAPDKRHAFAGETVKLQVKAAFFEGTPVPDLPLKFKMPDGDFNFTTDENGEYELSYDQPYYACGDPNGCWPRYAYLSVEPQEAELAEIKAETSLTFYGPKVQVYSRVEYPAAGQAEIEFTAQQYLDSQGEFYFSNDNRREPRPAAGVEIEAELTKIIHERQETGTRYDFISKKTYKTYSYSRREEPAGSFKLVSGEDGKALYRQAVLPNTSYRVRYKFIDQEGRYDSQASYFYYFNGRFADQYAGTDYKYYRLKLSEEDERYRIGESVNAVFVQNDEPLPERTGSYLYLRLQRGLLGYTLADGPEYSFRFSRQDVPNVNLAGVYFNGQAYYRADTGYWGGGAVYDYSERVLDIAVSTDKEVYQPGEEAVISALVTDQDGRPKQAEINFNLVDEAYYAVVDDQAAPLEKLYAGLGDGVLYSDISHFDIEDSLGGAEKGGCFLAGTEILMADGSKKRIEEIAVGDQVLTFSDPLSQAFDTGRVGEVWRHAVGHYLVINNELKVTPEHQMYSNNRFVDAGLLSIGDWLLNSRGEKIVIKSIQKKDEPVLVFNFRVDPQHTYFAGGFWVHNQEKGGGPREFFTDAALFTSVQTDSSGRAQVKLTLPDNITSWRITAQAISRDLYAGVAAAPLPVSLPVFLDVNINQEFLASDQPIVKLRAFGRDLSSEDELSMSVSSESLGLKDGITVAASPFKSAYIGLPAMVLGEHKLTFSLYSEKGEDALRLPAKVVESHLERLRSQEYELKPGLEFSPINERSHTIRFFDGGLSTVYQELKHLSWAWGDRVDQLLARRHSGLILEEYYGEDNYDYSFPFYQYQGSQGGINLLPYSSEEVELSARVAAAGAQDFDRLSLAQFFYSVIEGRSGRAEEVSAALFGLAELREPVLLKLQDWLERPDLPLLEKLYLTVALFGLGEQVQANELYEEILFSNGQRKEPYTIVKDSEDSDRLFRTTLWAAVLGESLGKKEAADMWRFVLDTQRLSDTRQGPKNSEQLFSLEKISYLKAAVKNLQPSPAEFEYELSGVSQEASVTGFRQHSLVLPAEELASLKILSVTGQATARLEALSAYDPDEDPIDKNIGIVRRYFVNGRETKVFKQSDTIEVRLYPRFDSQALEGAYQLTDYLPAGLAPIAKLYYWGYGLNCNYRYPYSSDGVAVKYVLDKYWNRNDWCGSDYIYYLARVKNPGEYRAEGAVIYSLKNPNNINFSSEQKVKIER